MAKIDSKYNIETTRGDILSLDVKAQNKDETFYQFKVGDIVRFKVMTKKKCDDIHVQKDFKVTQECESVRIILSSDEMKIGDIINKPVDYWYEVELNPDTSSTITILGYTKKDGPKLLTLTPEGGDKK